MNVWELLRDRWPFARELAEVPALNERFGLSGDDGFSAQLRPVCLVGDLDQEPEVLLIGLKPGLNNARSRAFQWERKALAGDFDVYCASRIDYFRSPALNRIHYWPAAKAVSTLLGDGFPDDPGAYLHQHAVQAELIPFFQHSAVLRAEDYYRIRKESCGGELSQLVLQSLLHARDWKAIVVRYSVTFEVFRRSYSLRSSLGHDELLVNGQSIPVYRLSGRPSDSDIIWTFQGDPTTEGRPAGDQSLLEDIDRSFEELREFALGLGGDVEPLPMRTNGSFVFKRRRNFATLCKPTSSLRIDVFSGTGWRNGVRVVPGIGVEDAKRLIREAYRLTG